MLFFPTVRESKKTRNFHWFENSFECENHRKKWFVNSVSAGWSEHLPIGDDCYIPSSGSSVNIMALLVASSVHVSEDTVKGKWYDESLYEQTSKQEFGKSHSDGGKFLFPLWLHLLLLPPCSSHSKQLGFLAVVWARHCAPISEPFCFLFCFPEMLHCSISTCFAPSPSSRCCLAAAFSARSSLAPFIKLQAPNPKFYILLLLIFSL